MHKIANQLPPIQILDNQGEAKNQIKRLKKSMEREFEREREAMKEKYRKKKKLLVIKRCKHFELGGDKKRKGQMIMFQAAETE